jgi:DNA-binding XRE family transcriptional regulator
MRPKTNIKAIVYTRTTTTVQCPNAIAYRIHPCEENECLKVAKFFQQRRTLCGLNCEEAAEQAGLTRYQWLALESGWIAPYESTIWRSLASTFLLNFEDLILLADASRRAYERLRTT